MTMSKQVEDTMYEIYQEIELNKLRKKFNKQLKEMETQSEHNIKTACEKWEYALRKIKE